MITQLNRKGVQIGLKNGWNEQDFTEKYECTAEELRDRICFLYDHGRDVEILKEIERNAKKQGGRKPRTKKSQQLAEEPTIIIVTAETEVEPTEPTLEDLVSQESNLSSQLMEAEAERFRILGERKSFADEIRKCQAEIRKILEKCNKYETQANAKGDEANILQGKIAELAVVLEETRRKISDARHIVLCVYVDGTIAPYDEGRSFDLNDFGHETLFLGLAQNDECSKLTIAEVKTLARMFKIEQNSDGYVLDWVCDNPELERVYRVISAAPETA